MFKKGILFIIILIQLLLLSGCPDEDKSSKEEETEQIPSTMEQAYDELDQIVTLLNGPMFSSRDMIEQLKSQQIQMLTDIIKNKSGQMDKIEQTTDSEAGKKEQENETGNGEEQQQNDNGNNQNEKEEDSGSDEEKTNNEQENGQDKKSAEEGKKADASDAEKAFQQEQSLFGIPQWNEENWKMIKVLADSLYFTWNSLQPELIKKGIASNQIGYFNTALEDMSQFITDKNIEQAQIAAFQMAEALAAFSSYYKTKTPAELKRIKSITVGIHFFAGQNDWKKSQELANQLQQEFAKLKALMKDNQSSSFQMLDCSLEDLNNSVQKQDSNLLVLRTNLVASNLHEMENELSQGGQ